MEIEVLTAAVNKQVLTITKSHTFVADTQNVYTASFTFDEEWEGFAKTVIFLNGDLLQFALLDEANQCVIPAGAVKAGYLEIGVQGNKNGQILTTKKETGVSIYKSGGSMNMVPEPFEQSEFDRLMDELANTRAFVNEQTETINQAVEDLNSAETGLAQTLNTAGRQEQDLLEAAELAENVKLELESDIIAANTAQTELSEATTTAVGTQEALETANQAAEDNLALLEGKNGEVESLVQRVNRVAPGVVCEAIGQVITLEDSAELPLQSLTIYGKSTQDGEPTPENPVEIDSVDNPILNLLGQNLAYVTLSPHYTSTNNNVIFTMIEKGVFTLDGTPSATNIVSLNQTSDLSIKSAKCILQKGKEYVIRDCQLYYVQPENNNFTSTIDAMDGQVKRTYNYDTYVLGIRALYRENITYSPDKIYRPAIYLAEQPISEPIIGDLQAITFPYTLRGIPAESGGNYTDENGQQWVCDTIQVNADGTGKLVQRCVEIVLDKVRGFYNFNVERAGFYQNNILPEDMEKRIGFCNACSISLSSIDAESNLIWIGENNKTIYLINSSYYDETLEDKGVANINAYLAENPLKIVTYVTTPTETELTKAEVQAFLALHTNKPYTTIFNTENSDMTVEYIADTKLYIDNKFTELQNAILSTGSDI